MRRLQSLVEFYDLLTVLERRMGGARVLSSCTARSGWPKRGVYFFFEPGEYRFESGEGLRVVRVGTHAVASTSSADLWSRLAAHKSGGHRASVFRKLIGASLIARDGHHVPTWGTSERDTVSERPHEARVGQVLGSMSLVVLEVDDLPGPRSMRSDVERGALSLLSNWDKPPLDAARAGWLGRYCRELKVRQSGLWNVQYVDRAGDPHFLDCFSRLIGKSPAAQPTAALSARALLERVKGELKAGVEVETLGLGRPNGIVCADSEQVYVQTSRGKGPQPVRWSWVGDALEVLCRTGRLEADDIPRPGRHRSSFIMAVIARFLSPWVESSRGVRIALRLKDVLPSAPASATLLRPGELR